jgi:molybdate transport system substrate-binding protein
MRVVTSLVMCLFCLMLFSVETQSAELSVSISAGLGLRDVINELSDSFTRKNPGVKIIRNYGCSGAVAKQIENGAPADIFISANLTWMEFMKERKLVDLASIGTFTYNSLVFIGPPNNKVTCMQDLTRLKKIAIGSPKSVPAGEYAMEAMKKAGIDRQLEKKLVMARDVRDCLMYSERGEVDGSFVYRSDALLAKHSKVLFTVPQELYSRVLFPMALTPAGTRNRAATAFFNYLQGSDAKAVLGKFGFASQ